MIEAKKFKNPNLYFVVAALCGILAGYSGNAYIFTGSEVVAEIFINLLRLVSLPIIFLSIVSTASGMENVGEIKNIGRRVIKYTLLTTVIAATVALMIYVTINPAHSVGKVVNPQTLAADEPGYFSYLRQVIPSNFVEPFVESHVLGVLFIAVLLSLATLSLPSENRKSLNLLFSSLFQAVIKITSWIVKLMPIAIFAFIVLFMKDLQKGMNAENEEGMKFEYLAWYLGCVVAANLVQGLIVLPLFLKFKGLSPLKLVKAMGPALSVAFFTKSSNAALPMAMKCAEENANISRKVASFSFPLCTTINMNGCAAFILTTVLFVSMSNGMTYNPVELVAWIFIATIAAVGNAGVPMGCYFLSASFLAAMKVPLNLMGLILPFYTLIDMLETAINVWSDSCVTAVVHQEVSSQEVDTETVQLASN